MMAEVSGTYVVARTITEDMFQESPIFCCPVEMLLKIMSNLNKEDLPNATLVCRLFNCIAFDKEIVRDELAAFRDALLYLAERPGGDHALQIRVEEIMKGDHFPSVKLM